MFNPSFHAAVLIDKPLIDLTQLFPSWNLSQTTRQAHEQVRAATKSTTRTRKSYFD